MTSYTAKLCDNCVDFRSVFSVNRYQKSKMSILVYACTLPWVKATFNQGIVYYIPRMKYFMCDMS